MKKLFLIVSGCMLSGGLSAQNLEEILAKYTEAMGGGDKLRSMQSVYMETVSVMQNGNEVTGKIWKVQDKLMRREMNFGMGSFTMVLTDKEGFSSNPRNGGKFEAMPPEQVQAMQSELDCAGPLFDYAAKGHKAELIGKEDVGGTECFVVKLTLKSGRDITYYIDPKTYHILRAKTKGGRMGGRPGGNPDAEIITEYSDYRKNEEGFVFPFATTVVGMGASTNFEKIEVNKPVDPALYKAN
jgi:outer membrane lipoprotein-sorting protein